MTWHAGELPAFPSASEANFIVKPGNPGLCGGIPAAPLYQIAKTAPDSALPLESLPSCATPGAEVLLALKANLTNGEEALPSWVPSSDPCANWTGITCANGTITVM